jgi:hypothetical protein
VAWRSESSTGGSFRLCSASPHATTCTVGHWRLQIKVNRLDMYHTLH